MANYIKNFLPSLLIFRLFKRTFTIFFFCLLLQTKALEAYDSVPPCDLSDNDFSYFVEQARIGNTPHLRAIEECAKSNRKLFAAIIDINPDYFRFASDYLKDDEAFISKFVAQNPEILKHISSRLASDKFFMFKMTRFYSGALSYTSQKLTDNKGFMTEMIKLNSQNFSYASERLQDNYDLTLLAVKQDGKMLKFASARLQNDRKIVSEAIKSYALAINYASDNLQKDKAIKRLSSLLNYKFLEDFDEYLKENYGGLGVGPKGVRGYHIVNLAKNYPEKQIIYHPYITKWEQVYDRGVATNDIKLATKTINNGGWKADFVKYPELITAIEKVFISQKLDPNTIEGLNTVSLWEVSDKPKTLAFDLYLLRQIDAKYLNTSTSNIILLSAIAKEVNIGNKKQWDIKIVDAIFDADIKMSVAYENGHRRYKIWDLYTVNKDDKNPKILFKVEDKDVEYFELFAKQLNGRYASIYKGGGYAMDINIFENISTNH